MSRRLEGNVALVTGAASGIGKATADLFTSEGATVIRTDVTRADDVVRLDVASEAEWQSALSGVIAQHARLDVLVNNAAVNIGGPVDRLSLDEWRRVMSVNLDGVFLGTKHAIRTMRAANPERRGVIVNVSSGSGLRAAATAAAYCTSKAAVSMFTKAAALDCCAAGDDIRINSVAPAAVRTPAWENNDWFPDLVRRHGGVEEAWAAVGGIVPLGRVAQPEEIARAILFLCTDDSSYMTGSELIVDGGYTAWARDVKTPKS